MAGLVSLFNPEKKKQGAGAAKRCTGSPAQVLNVSSVESHPIFSIREGVKTYFLRTCQPPILKLNIEK